MKNNNKMSDLCQDIAMKIQEMEKLYNTDDSLNDIQPDGFSNLIGVSLDQLTLNWKDMANKWDEIKTI